MLRWEQRDETHELLCGEEVLAQVRKITAPPATDWFAVDSSIKWVLTHFPTLEEAKEWAEKQANEFLERLGVVHRDDVLFLKSDTPEYYSTVPCDDVASYDEYLSCLVANMADGLDEECGVFEAVPAYHAPPIYVVWKRGGQGGTEYSVHATEEAADVALGAGCIKFTPTLNDLVVRGLKTQTRWLPPMKYAVGDTLLTAVVGREGEGVLIEITGVRVEYLQSISDEDLKMEGQFTRDNFAEMWNTIYPASPWAANPRVVVYTFRECDYC